MRKTKDDGVTILTATHDLFYAKQSGQYIGIMKQRRLVTNLNSEDATHIDLEQLYPQHMRKL